MTASISHSTSLDRLYSPSYWSHRLSRGIIVEEHLRFMLDATLNARHDFTHCISLDNAYSSDPLSKYDVYFPMKQKLSPLSPILMYIHGGYWTMMSKEYSGLSIIV